MGLKGAMTLRAPGTSEPKWLTNTCNSAGLYGESFTAAVNDRDQQKTRLVQVLQLYEKHHKGYHLDKGLSIVRLTGSTS